jgi:C_GCAxxG_C_C family probable redox protein
MMTFTRRDIFKNIGMCSAAILASGLAAPMVQAIMPAAAPTGDQLGPWAAKRFLAHWNCSQAVMEAFAEAYKLDMETARKISMAFAGGMCAGEMCGSFTGALMVIGLAHGKAGAPSPEVAGRTTEFLAAMKTQFGSLSCSALLGTDMATPQGVKQAADNGLFKSFCPTLVEAAVGKLQAIL